MYDIVYTIKCVKVRGLFYGLFIFFNLYMSTGYQTQITRLVHKGILTAEPISLANNLIS